MLSRRFLALALIPAAALFIPSYLDPRPTASPSTVLVDAQVSGDETGRATHLAAPPLTTHRAGDLLLALVAADGPASSRQSITRVSGGGLAWHLVRRANGAAGTAEVWAAQATGTVAAATVVAGIASGDYGGSITVVALAGADSTTPLGMTSAGSAPSGAAALPITPDATGSSVWAVGEDWDTATAHRVLRGQTLVHEHVAMTSGNDYWVEQLAAPAPNAATTIGTAAPTGDRWDLVAVEVRASGSRGVTRGGGSGAGPPIPAPPPTPDPTSTPPGGTPPPGSPPPTLAPTPAPTPGTTPTPPPGGPPPPPTPVPTPKPKPTPPAPPPPPPPPPPSNRNCVASPHSCGYPDATNTGVPGGTALHASGDITVTQAGAVLSGLAVSGSVYIDAPNVTIRSSRIDAGGNDHAVYVQSGSVTLADVEITGSTAGAVVYDNWTCRRCNIHATHDDATKLGSNVTLQDSYVHDVACTPGNHCDGGQMQNGEINIVVRHNTIVGFDNSALFIAPDLGPSANGPVTIADNLLGGGNFTLYFVDGNNGQYHERNVSVTGNRFVADSKYGPDDVNEPVTWTGNYWDATGAPVPL